MRNLEARIRALEAEFGPIEPESEWDGYSEEIRSALASCGMLAAAIVARTAEKEDRTLERRGERGPTYECAAAVVNTMTEMQAKFQSEGLLHAPLDDFQKARVEQIEAEMKAALGPKPESYLLDVGGDVQRLDGGQGEVVGLAPGEEIAGGTGVGFPSVRVADGGGEEFEEPLCRPLSGVGDDCGEERPAASGRGSGGGGDY
jgi:hypothetical protein